MELPAEKIDEAERLIGQLEAVESQLRELQEGLTRSHRLATLGTLASIIAHEFNNILTPMISYCQLAAKSPDDMELLRKAVDRSLKGALRAAQISSSMLGFAREADDTPQANIAAVIEEVFGCMALPPEKDGIKLTVEVAADLHAAISATALQQVLLNLVINARQAMRRRGGKLTIRAAEQGEGVVIEVADTGPGIAQEIRDRVFEPFVTRREANEEAGTGLGLAICRVLVARAGGTIEVAQSGPSGTVFRVEVSRVES